MLSPPSEMKILPVLVTTSRKNENFVSISENLLKNRNWTFHVVRYFAWKLEFVSNILWMIVGTLTYLKMKAVLEELKLNCQNICWKGSCNGHN